MKRFFCLVLSLALLLGMLPLNTRAEEPFRFTQENFPRMDGSTSLVPLGTGIVSALLGKTREEAAAMVAFNRTTQSFRNLANGYCDIVLAAEPKSDVFTEMEQLGFRYEIQQIAKEALVFVVNENNPVDSLTAEQLRGIYSGEITNWSEVGGEDLPIDAFQRNAASGSQVMMEKLVMQGREMMKAPSAMIPGEMAQLIEAVKNYDNSASAIGYTVYYYAADMQMASGLKILQVDGIAPEPATLRDESYPFLNGYYACIAGDATQDAPQRILYNWLISDAGQRLLELEGYVPVYAAGAAPTTGDAVAADYSGYTPNGGQPAKFTEFDCPHDSFEPRSDYGNIYPYSGARLYAGYTFENSTYDYPLRSPQGFFNHNGERITDPIYSFVTRLGRDGGYGEDYLWLVTDQEGMAGCIAKDGSIATGQIYVYLYSIGDALLGVRNEARTEFDLLDWQLNLLKTQADFTVDGRVYLPTECYSGLTCCVDSAYYSEGGESHYAILNESGQVLTESDGYLSLDHHGIIAQYDSDWKTTLYLPDLTPLADPALPAYDYTCLTDNFYRIMADSRDYIVDWGGSEFEWGYDDAAYCTEDTFRVIRGDRSKIYSDTGRLLYEDIPVSWDYQGDGIFIENLPEGGVTLHRLSDGKSLSLPDAYYGYRIGSLLFIQNKIGDADPTVLDLEFNILPDIFRDASPFYDSITGKEYFACYNANGFAGEIILMESDYRTELLRTSGTLDLQGGYITISDDWAFRCYSPDGELIFCYPYYGMSGD